MKFAVEMSSGVMIYIPSFIKIGSRIEKSVWGGIQTDIISIILFFSK
jgi:hypothetical protein